MNTQYEQTRTRLNELARQLAGGSTPEAPDEWGGADVVICAKPPKKPKEPGFSPEPRTVVTPHSRHLTWLFYQLRDAFYEHDLLDHLTKIEFFGRLANAALRYQARCGGTEARKDLLFAVLHEAFAMLDELEEGSFQCLEVAFGNTIVDDFIESEETMANSATCLVPVAIQRIANAPDRRLAWEFFIFFSRFEYALKRDRRYLMPGAGDAQPNWDRFASDQNSRFLPEASTTLQTAVDYYVAHSPRKQLRDDGKMSWSEPLVWDEREPRLVWLLRVVRTVRNNLFHGGKFPLLPVAEASRDCALIAHGLTLLSGALELDRDVRRQFLDGLE